MKYGVPYRLPDGSVNPDWNRAYNDRPETKEYRRRWYAANKDRLNAKRRDQPRKRAPKDYRTMVVSLLRARDGNDCGLCGQPLTESIEVDHVVPVAHGGSHEADNLRLTHSACNQARARGARWTASISTS